MLGMCLSTLAEKGDACGNYRVALGTSGLTAEEAVPRGAAEEQSACCVHGSCFSEPFLAMRNIALQHRHERHIRTSASGQSTSLVSLQHGQFADWFLQWTLVFRPELQRHVYVLLRGLCGACAGVTSSLTLR